MPIDAWAKWWFDSDAKDDAWAKLTPGQKLDRLQPEWRQLAASKAFKDWLETAPASDQDAARKNGSQIVDAVAAATVLRDFKAAQHSSSH
jgi:hypothetical protein